MCDQTRPEDQQPLVEIVCRGCGLTTVFSADEPEDRRVCPECAGYTPDECCEDCADA